MTKNFCDICGIELDEEDRGMRKWSWAVVESNRYCHVTIQHDPFVMDFCEPCFKKFKDVIKDLVKKEWKHDC